ncbi:hypothetical protein BIW11_07150, partial [Tropilaelaps mercedesae]
DYLEHAPCFKAMLLEGGACHNEYVRLKAVTIAMDPTSGHHLYDHETEPSRGNGPTSTEQQKSATDRRNHYPIDRKLIADMCCEYHALHACYMEKTEAACGPKALKVSLRSLNKLNGGMQYSCAKVRRRCAGYVVSSSATRSADNSILRAAYDLLTSLFTLS